MYNILYFGVTNKSQNVIPDTFWWHSRHKNQDILTFLSKFSLFGPNACHHFHAKCKIICCFNSRVNEMMRHKNTELIRNAAGLSLKERLILDNDDLIYTERSAIRRILICGRREQKCSQRYFTSKQLELKAQNEQPNSLYFSFRITHSFLSMLPHANIMHTI